MDKPRPPQVILPWKTQQTQKTKIKGGYRARQNRGENVLESYSALSGADCQPAFPTGAIRNCTQPESSRATGHPEGSTLMGNAPFVEVASVGVSFERPHREMASGEISRHVPFVLLAGPASVSLPPASTHPQAPVRRIGFRLSC